MRINYSAPQHVSEVIASLKRPEDIKFSPSNRRLAAAFSDSNVIGIFDIRLAKTTDREQIILTDVAIISSPCLQYPHGIDFIEENVIVVANRFDGVAIFKLPPAARSSSSHELQPLAVLPSGEDTTLLNSPGSVSSTKIAENLYQALVCNASGHYVTRHILDLRKNFSVQSSEILLKKGLYIPDGICVSDDNQWIAVSNHQMQTAFIYQNTPSLNEFSDPDGILRCAYYPHGLRFTSDGRFLIAADAGAPYVHIYRREDSGWGGVRNPLGSYKVVSNDDFLRARIKEGPTRINTEEGGPKGIDIDSAMSVLVLTSECEPLAFFDLKKVLEQLQKQPKLEPPDSFWADQSALELGYELDVRANAYQSRVRADQTQVRVSQAENRVNQAEERAKKAEERAFHAELLASALINSTIWRSTAPLRWIISWLRSLAFITRRGAV
jgi:hypothetical protein